MFELSIQDIENNIEQFVHDLDEAVYICSERGMIEASLWALEMVIGYDPIRSGKCKTSDVEKPDREALLSIGMSADESDQYHLALSLFKNRDYKQAIEVLGEPMHPKTTFLRFYSEYKLFEKKSEGITFDRLANGHDIFSAMATDITELESLSEELERLFNKKKLDPFGLYIYGVVLLKQHKRRLHQDHHHYPDQKQEQEETNTLEATAKKVLIMSIRGYPYNWSAWLELASTVYNYEQYADFQILLKIRLMDDPFIETPVKIMVNLILARICSFLELNIDLYAEVIIHLKQYYFRNSPYMIGEWAKYLYIKKDHIEAARVFRELRAMFPARMSEMEIYSSLLFHTSDKQELKELADICTSTNEGTVEACIIRGNYFKIQNQFSQSNDYFTRAIMVQPDNHMAWLGLGHNYLELSKPLAAVKAYTQAIAIKEDDYRSYFGLGRAYEMMKAIKDALHYYQRASDLCGDDTYAWMSLGESFERLGKQSKAKECFAKVNIQRA
ncbi:hypothetical protein BDF20DRAFT_836433 [Mycotypha africana]|uniref:uncharacterized protein n=1 Tax=Mycotypha africana TaxID=64632 RepID=UPI002301C0DA|nr:uncharacterized protein BDF20DRAFT_836433 [Mycotypha africana]KAI8977657.1 hypothetical protein BDF20DRAFT_836433 [Mycotypha africana]